MQLIQPMQSDTEEAEEEDEGVSEEIEVMMRKKKLS